jgi:hypothetical protein
MIYVLSNLWSSYNESEVQCSDPSILNYAKSDWSDSIINPDFQNNSNNSLIDFQIYSPYQIYSSNHGDDNYKCVGYYSLKNIDNENQIVFYNLQLYKDYFLPEKFDLFFEKNDSFLGSIFNFGKKAPYKMVINPKII